MKNNYMHRIWLGGDMPIKFQNYGQEWSRLNPGSQLLDWNETELAELEWINQAVLDDMTAQSKMPGADMIAYYTHMADVMDYELLYKSGGWYFNTDLKPLKSLDTLEFDPTQPALAMEDDIHPVNMAMYCPQGHPFMKKVIDILPQRYFGMPGEFMNATTGVQLLQHAIQEYGPVQTFDRKVFNPIHFTEFGYGDEPNIERVYPEETVAVHLWGHRTNKRGQRVLEQ